MARTREIYTHGHHESVLRSHLWRTVENSAAYLVPHLRPGLAVLDVGCGPGNLTIDLAARVSGGRVVGVDNTDGPLGLARKAAAGADVSDVSFEAGDVYDLRFDDGSFDVIHAHQVLQHLTDPVSALREMRRVCRPDGVVAARDADYSAMTWHPAHPGLDAWLELYGKVTRHNGGEPQAGRHLRAWARAAGFSDVTSSASAWCFSTPDERAWWGGSWADRVVSSSLAEQAPLDWPLARTWRRCRRPGEAGARKTTAGLPSCTARSFAGPSSIPLGTTQPAGTRPGWRRRQRLRRPSRDRMSARP